MTLSSCGRQGARNQNTGDSHRELILIAEFFEAFVEDVIGRFVVLVDVVVPLRLHRDRMTVIPASDSMGCMGKYGDYK